jgi:hypothetical protein
MKRTLELIGGIGATVILILWTGAKVMLDWLGRGVVLKDLGVQDSTASQIFHWIFATPWYVPAGLATLATGAAVYAFLRKDSVPQAPAGNAVQSLPPYGPFGTAAKRIFRQNYVNELVILDGCEFIECTFENITLEFNGTANYTLLNCKFIIDEGKWKIKYQTRNPAVEAAWVLYNNVGPKGEKAEMYVVDPKQR